MKMSSFKFIIFMMFTSLSFGQHHEVKMRTFGAIARNYGFSYEYTFKKLVGINLLYNTTNKRPVLFTEPSGFSNSSNYKHYNITPDVRFYFDGDGKGKFTSIYYRFQKSTSGKVDDSNNSFDQTYEGMSAGITYGYKFVQRKGFLIELYFGGGYVFKRKFQFDGAIGDDDDRFSDETTDNIDPRFAIQIGYRF